MNKLLSSAPICFPIFAVFRIFVGLLILNHGLVVFNGQKMNEMAGFLEKSLSLPFPLLMAYLAKGSEFFGGALLALGFLTRFALVPLIVTMLVAVFGSHSGLIFGEAEHAFLFLIAFFAIFFAGAGSWSIDKLLFKTPRGAKC